MDKIKAWISGIFLSKYLGMGVRHALSGLGGWLMGLGIIKETSAIDALTNPSIEIISAIILFLIAGGSSVKRK